MSKRWLLLFLLVCYSVPVFSASSSIDPKQSIGKQLQEWKQRIEQLQSELSEYAERLRQSQQELQELQARLATLQTDLLDLHQTLEASQTDLIESLEHSESLSTSLRELQRSLAAERLRRIRQSIIVGAAAFAVGVLGGILIMIFL